jgi:hypothetical protein
MRMLLQKPKTVAQADLVTRFVSKLKQETDRNFGVVPAYIKAQFRELLETIAPEILSSYDELAVAIGEVTLGSIEYVLGSTSLASSALLEALSLAFGSSEEVQIWGPFGQWPAKIAHSRVRSYRLRDT